MQNLSLTWLPKTPIEHAELTWLGPNQTAASLVGSESMKTWLAATIACPINASQKRSGPTPKTFIQAPKHVPRHPKIAAILKPWKI